ncbi:hypothetical protein [Planococcus alpniumensis]|uniref:hypothetical protein n=1 Tax=Planococcus alpniumensis TaxID=2708345 RepID=UPI001B8D0906|nr:hypothetical protein [Planococcus sp. MSAK28401]
MILHMILLISCCMLLLLEAVLTEHAKWLKTFERAEIASKQELTDEDIQKGWGFNQPAASTPVAAPAISEKELTPVYKESQLTSEHESFFDALALMAEPTSVSSKEEDEIPFLETAPSNQENEMEAEEYVSWDQVVAESEVAENEAKEEIISESEFLTMEDWKEEPMPVSMSNQLSAKASHKIGEGFVGEQLWVVEVVGYEQSYIHVSDGESRAWLNLRKLHRANKGDILTLLVEQDESDQLYVLQVDVLQQKSTDFALEIEEEFENEHIDFYEAI